MRILGWVIALLALAYAGICIAAYSYQRSLIYYPQPRSITAAASTLKLQVPGADLIVTVRQAKGTKALVYFGGNGEDVSYNLPALSEAFPEHAIYLLHYRGYGGSTGSPSEADISADALALFDKIHTQHAEVLVIGRSLGSGVAVRLASQRPVNRLVLVTPYDSIRALAASAFPWLPVRWLLRDNYDSTSYAPAVSAKTLVIEAEHDEVIPSASTRRLLAAFKPGVASLKVIPGVGHNDISNTPLYMAALAGKP
ncbi:MAG: alpha/beta fold hydrolase [Polaromonas sp.]|nr:alpha/beta fold hydrolase [Polaromonas sp.]